MTTSKDLKRLVRARMSKTGESYTAARAQLLRKASPRRGPRPSPATPDYAILAGMADDKVLAKTGRTWAEWVHLLDGHGAATLPHRDVARVLHDSFAIPSWWAQTVTVGYERIKGKRAIGQRMNGSFEATKSRTFAISAGRLFDAWASPASRKKWLGSEPLTLRTSNRPKYVRLRHADGSTVVVGFTAKGRSKTSVAVQHGGLPSREAADARRAFWSDCLDGLRKILS